MTSGDRAASRTVLTVLLMVLGTTHAAAVSADLDFERRVEAQRAIEEVYWRHRLWPGQNPAPKPAFSAVLSDEAIRARVEAYLAKSNALETWWQRPITAEQLQAEIDRMSRQTRAPEILRELYASLGDDGFVIAETLARQTLAERLIRNWYASDDRFHGQTRREAETARAGMSSVAEMRALGGKYVEQRFLLRDDGDRRADASSDLRQEGAIELDVEEWKEWTTDLARQFDASPEELPLDRPSKLQEDEDRFVVSAVLSLTPGEALVASVIWPKQSFDDWWADARQGASVDIEEATAAYEVAAPLDSGCADDTWEERYYVPTGRSWHTAVWTGTEMILWGGDNGSELNTGGRYNPSMDTWTATSTGVNTPSPRTNHTAVWTGTEMIVWGGGGSEDFMTGGRYDPSADTWAPTSTVAAPAPRAYHTAVWTGTEMIVWGGVNALVLNTGGRYNPSTNVWTATSMTNVPGLRIDHTAVWTGTEMIVWGGRTGAFYFTNTGGRYNPSTNSWTATPTGLNAPTERTNHTAVWTGTEMIVWGGRDLDYLGTGGRFNPETNVWTATPSLTGRVGHVAVWTGTEMIVWGGEGFALPNTGYRYDPSTNSWTTISTTNQPSQRTDPTAVWTGAEMIVWGGEDAHLNTGGRYNPSTNSWIATSRGASVPATRRTHTAVWTGTEMIVWGGRESQFFSVPLGTGGRYNPSVDSWTATSTSTNVPAARYEHTAVWTGTEMIVWGGRGGPYHDTGGRYNPSADSWTATSTGTNVPSPRIGHTAVWTGTQMIVWGGLTGGNIYVNAGGRYDPTADSWTATSTDANVPAGRYEHTAVWTGTEMIVWGGAPASGYFNTGGRYDPSMDSWKTTSTEASVPAGRRSHTAVWTGTEMIVWGGYASGKLNTGGRYNPSTNVWTATAMTNVPSPRDYHTAVSTGTEVIVWGGLGSGSGRTGGRYNPSVDSWTAMPTGASAPSARYDHIAVWTGAEMIVWGGVAPDSNLYLYCASACSSNPDGEGQTWYGDVDGDGFGNAGNAIVACAQPTGFVTNATDCSDGDGGIWAVPGEARDLRFIDDDTLLWSAPSALGGSSVAYDVMRSAAPSDFLDPVCLEIADGPNTSADDPADPFPGQLFSYLVRAENPCGEGPLGEGTPPRVASSCAEPS